MTSTLASAYLHLERQVRHWILAGERLSALEDLAAPEAWQSLESYLGLAIRESLNASLAALRQEGKMLERSLSGQPGQEVLPLLVKATDRYRKQYLRTETVLDFYADAINTRTNPRMASLMRACDYICRQAMTTILDPLGQETPPVLTYIDKGLGASILKAGLRLWDRKTENPAAVIKVVRHNVFRPTSLVHESGHQVAYMLGWNEELRAELRGALQAESEELAEAWASWASEIAADVFGFVHTGYASVASLHDVVSGNHRWVFRYTPGDPHPISYLRVLLGVAFCKRSFGAGPWDQLAKLWMQKHPISQADADLRPLLRESLKVLPKIARLCLEKPLQSFGGKSLISWIPPEQVSPGSLQALQQKIGHDAGRHARYAPQYPLQLLGLSGLNIAITPRKSRNLVLLQESWMKALGNMPLQLV
ncbi:MAG: hypothetical protein AAFR61_29635 [Bacteroidota bacterium]